MKINSNIIVAAILGGVTLVFLLRYQTQAAAFLATVKHIGPGNSPEDKTLGLIVIGLREQCLLRWSASSPTTKTTNKIKQHENK